MEKFVINSNLKSSGSCSIHDNINFVPIERQVEHFIKQTNLFESIEYSPEGKSPMFILDVIYCFNLTIKKSKIDLKACCNQNAFDSFFRLGDYGSDQFGSTLHYNKDMTTNFLKFLNKIKEYSNVYLEARSLVKEFEESFKIKPIEDFLNESLGTATHRVSCWHYSYNLFRNFYFYLHPKGGAPADGGFFYINSDGKIVFKDSKAEDCWKKWDAPKNAAEMLKRAEQIKEIEENFKNFDANKSPELASYLKSIERGLQIKNKLGK